MILNNGVERGGLRASSMRKRRYLILRRGLGIGVVKSELTRLEILIVLMVEWGWRRGHRRGVSAGVSGGQANLLG